MGNSKVYFSDFRTTNGVSLTTKLQKLIRRAGIGEIDFNGKFVAIKMHFGELGNLASFDPVALDQACVDLCQKAEPVRNSQLGDNMASEHFHDHGDVWHNSNPNVSWAETLEHAQKIGVGTREYELIVMK